MHEDLSGVRNAQPLMDMQSPTLVVIRLFLPPNVSIRDTPLSASLQNLTGYTSPSFCTVFSYGSEKL